MLDISEGLRSGCDMLGSSLPSATVGDCAAHASSVGANVFAIDGMNTCSAAGCEDKTKLMLASGSAAHIYVFDCEGQLNRAF